MFSFIKFTNLSGETILILLLKSWLHNKILSTELDQLCTGIKLYHEEDLGLISRLLIF